MVVDGFVCWRDSRAETVEARPREEMSRPMMRVQLSSAN